MTSFSVNLSVLFREHTFLERFEQAARAGFSAVEFWWPSGEDLSEVEAAIADSGVEVILFNLDAGDMSRGDRGLLSDPSRAAEFSRNLPVAIDLAQRLGCKQLNALLGLEIATMTGETQLDLAAENLRRAAAAAAEVGAKVLVEAVNTLENGPYLVAHTEDAAQLIARVGAANLALQYDAYHMQRMEGNLADTLRRFRNQIAHVQIADCPGRAEPGTGEINFPFLLRVLDEIGYDGHVGLEYVPSTQRTEDSFSWLPELNRSGRGLSDG